MFDKQPGFRYAEYEVRGVPVRVEIGPKDIEKSACAVARRDVPGKEGKQFGVPLTGAAAHIEKLLRDIQKALYDRAKTFRDERIVTANTLDEFKALFPVGEGRRGRRGAAEVRLRPLGRHARDGGPRAEGVQGDDPLPAVRRPEGDGDVHLHRQAVGAPRGVRAGVLIGPRWLDSLRSATTRFACVSTISPSTFELRPRRRR